MVRFLEDAKDETTKKNKEAVKSMTISITVKDEDSGKEKVYEADKITDIRFKDRKKKIFVRFKCENGTIVSIPKSAMPRFIKVEVEKTKVW
jgi:hypothetical protein